MHGFPLELLPSRVAVQHKADTKELLSMNTEEKKLS